MSAPDYRLVGRRVHVHLYDRSGRLLGALEGRIADVARAVDVGRSPGGTPIKKDLAYVVDIAPLPGPDDSTVPYRNSAGTEGEGWFAIQDLTLLGDGPVLPTN